MAQERTGRMVRRVTDVDVVRSSHEPGRPGTYQFDLELDGGVESYVLPGGEDIDTVLRLLQRSGGTLLDTRTQELTFEHYGTRGGDDDD